MMTRQRLGGGVFRRTFRHVCFPAPQRVRHSDREIGECRPPPHPTARNSYAILREAVTSKQNRIFVAAGEKHLRPCPFAACEVLRQWTADCLFISRVRSSSNRAGLSSV